MWCCTGLDDLYLAPPCTWTESNCYIYTRPSKSCRAPWCTFEHTLHCLYCPSRHLHQTPAHPGSISYTAVNFHPSSGSSDLWKKKWHQLLSPLGKSPVFCWSSAIDKQNLLTAHSKVDAVRWLNNLHFMIYGGDRQVDMPRWWYLPLPWASVHWLVQCTLECHWNVTGWPSVHWDTTGKTQLKQPTLECHWRDLVESAPHWDATGETLTFAAYTGTPLEGLWQPTHAPTHIVKYAE